MRNAYLDRFKNQVPIHEAILPAATGIILKLTREYQGLTQSQLCDRILMNNSYISDVENGMSRISIIKLFSICNGLGVQPAGVVSRISDVQSRTILTGNGLFAADLAFQISRYSAEALAIEQLVKAGNPVLDAPFMFPRPTGPLLGS